VYCVIPMHNEHCSLLAALNAATVYKVALYALSLTSIAPADHVQVGFRVSRVRVRVMSYGSSNSHPHQLRLLPSILGM